MKKHITSKPSFLGYVYYYDEKGRCIGKSRPSVVGEGKVVYDANGKQIGTSRPGFLAKEVYHDEEKGRYISSYEGLNGEVHFENGIPVGASHPGFGGAKYTVMDIEDETDEEYFTEDEFLECEDLQELPTCGADNQKTLFTNIIVFAACFLVVGILLLILS